MMNTQKNSTESKQLTIDFSKAYLSDEPSEFQKEMDDRLYEMRRMIARNCISLRKIAGLTQTQLAEKIELSQSHVNYVESGLGNPSMGILAKIAKGLEVEITDFFMKSLWEINHHSKDSFSVIKGHKIQMKKLATQLPEGWDFQSIFLESKGELSIPAKKKMFRQFYFCTQGAIEIKGSEVDIVLQKDEGLSVEGPQSLTMISRSLGASEILHLCYREK